MNKINASIVSVLTIVCGGGMGAYLYNSQTSNVQSNTLVQSTGESSNNLNHSSVQNVTYNIHHNHYYTTEQSKK